MLEWTRELLLGVGGGVLGAILTAGLTPPIHRWWRNREAREDAARFLLRGAERVRQAFHGIAAKVGNRSVFEMIGPAALREDLEALIVALEELKGARQQLLDLRDENLEKTIVEAVQPAERQQSTLVKQASPFYLENLRPDRPWDRSMRQLFDMPAESIRTHYLPVWDAIIARLKARATASALAG